MDPITLEVLGYRMGEVVHTMEHLLFHSGYSPILRESYDGSATILDRNGYVVAGSGAPYHLFPYYYTAQYIIDRFKGEISPGDSFMANDPYHSGNSHVPDMAVVTPVFFDGEIIAYTACIAHKPDLGGLVPGSSSAGAREIFHEGVLFPGVRIWSNDGINRDVEAILRQNSRTPDEVAGDVRAQVGCTQVGAQRIVSLCQEYSAEEICQAFEEWIVISQRRLGDELEKIPDGVGVGTAYLDNDSVDLDRPVKIEVKVTKSGSRISLDFSGSNEIVTGPVNIRPQSTEAGATLVLIGLLDPKIPINDGIRRAVEFINPPGRVTHAVFPAPVNNYYPTMHLVYCSVLKAMDQLTGRVVAPAALGIGGNTIGYVKARNGLPAVQYELQNTSLGGTPSNDGAFGAMAMNQVTPSTSLEILETEYPMRVTRFEPLVDSAGPGEFRGGVGYVREYELLSAAKLSIRMGQFKFGGWGVNGGKGPKTTAKAVLNDGSDTEELLPPLQTRDLPSGTRFAIKMSGGGGYGNPYKRDPQRVLLDVTNGYVSVEAAVEDYGVAINRDSMTVDDEKTLELRSNKTKERG
ncbi:MAG: hydantoinase B/oxoprolinase family protein [Actinobacteria bacterium]|jgi:N-methylhydantoinase B|nr:hydantoinase B/oxoprolinase family protein [Actinomycetota bacterium]